jgi:hypothetical protein
MCAFRVLRVRDLLRLDMSEMTYGWNLEMQIKAPRAGLRVREVPLPYYCRVAGASKVAGNMRGTVRAGTRIVGTLLRVAPHESSGLESTLRFRALADECYACEPTLPFFKCFLGAQWGRAVDLVAVPGTLDDKILPLALHATVPGHLVTAHFLVAYA